MKCWSSSSVVWGCFHSAWLERWKTLTANKLTFYLDRSVLIVSSQHQWKQVRGKRWGLCCELNPNTRQYFHMHMTSTRWLLFRASLQLIVEGKIELKLGRKRPCRGRLEQYLECCQRWCKGNIDFQGLRQSPRKKNEDSLLCKSAQ